MQHPRVGSGSETLETVKNVMGGEEKETTYRKIAEKAVYG
jgi:hypothetical protein